MANIRGVPPPGAIRLRERRVAREIAKGMQMFLDVGWSGALGRFEDDERALSKLKELGHPALKDMQ